MCFCFEGQIATTIDNYIILFYTTEKQKHKKNILINRHQVYPCIIFEFTSSVEIKHVAVIFLALMIKTSLLFQREQVFKCGADQSVRGNIFDI